MLKFKCIADGNSDNDSDTSGAAGGGVAGGTPPEIGLTRKFLAAPLT